MAKKVWRVVKLAACGYWPTDTNLLENEIEHRCQIHNLPAIANDKLHKRLQLMISQCQLENVAVDSMLETERELLASLDQEINCCCERHSIPHGRQRQLILGLLLRRLSLVWKNIKKENHDCQTLSIRAIAGYAKHDDNSYGQAVFAFCLNTQKHKAEYMYNGLLAAYTTVYRKKFSPFSTNWSMEHYIEAFGNNSKLIDLFQQYVKAERKYCNSFRPYSK